MVEARIECLCPEFDLRDLRLRMRRGDVEWVSEDVARRSADLALAVQSGAVSVVYARRCSVSRFPPPPNVRVGRARRGVVTQTSQPQPTVARAVVPVVESKSIDAKAIEEAIASGVARAIQGLLASGAFVPASGGAAPIPATAPRTVAATASPVVASDPVYIPTNIVPSDDATTITIAESSSEGSDLEAAAAALKATRKRKTTSSTETP